MTRRQLVVAVATVLALGTLAACGRGASASPATERVSATPTGLPWRPCASSTCPAHVAITRPGKVPAYTVADMRAYLLQVGFPLGALANGDMPPITKIEFVTREEAETLMRGESLEGLVAPGAIVCYVEFGGPIIYGGMRDPSARPNATFAFGQEVFDATTGGNLMEGVLP